MNKSTVIDLQLNLELLKLSQVQSIDSGDLLLSLKSISTTMSQALHVFRSSIWFYNEDQTSLVCHNLFESESNTHSAGIELKAQDFPAYFNYLKEERTLPAHDACTDPATFEFAEVYLKPLKIISMLDAPIRVNGKMIGVVCCEHTGSMRNWLISEQGFIGNIADIVARAIQSRDKAIALLKLEEMNSQLEELVRQRTEELEEQRERTANSSKMAVLGEMASSIAHEINNPLAIIVASTNQLKKLESKGELDPEKLKELVQDIELTTIRISKIIKGLRFFARDASLDAKEEFSMGQIIEDTLALCQEKFIMNGCKIETFISESRPKIKCQPVSISQALLNLLSNSFDAVSALEDKWIRIECFEEKDYVFLRVLDSGKGISSDIREKMMIPFYTTKPFGKGTGLGLSIVKGIVENHYGEFYLDDKALSTCFVMKFLKK